MDSEDTTTSNGQIDEQASQTQPEVVDTEQAVIEEDTSSVDTPDSAEDDTDESYEDKSLEDWDDDDYIKWAEKKGIKTDNPVAMLKMVRGAEKKMHETQNSIEARKLREAVAETDVYNGASDVDLALNRLTVREFYLDNPDAKQYDAEMAELVREKPYLAGDLDTLLLIAKAKSSSVKEDVIKKQARKEALVEAAKAEAAAPPIKSASTRETPKEISDEDIANMSLTEYKAWKESEGFNPFVAPR